MKDSGFYQETMKDYLLLLVQKAPHNSSAPVGQAFAHAGNRPSIRPE